MHIYGHSYIKSVIRGIKILKILNDLFSHAFCSIHKDAVYEILLQYPINIQFEYRHV